MVDAPSSSLSVTLSHTNTSTPIVGDGDHFASRIVLTGSYGNYTGIDLSAATLGSGEPNSLGMTGSWWFEYLQLTDKVDNLRVRLYGGAGAIRVAVYRSTNANTDPAEGIDPAFSDLSLVASSTTGDVTWATTDTDASYYIQVGVASGTGTGWSMEYTYADPGDGGTFDTAIDLGNTTYGYGSVDLWNDVLETGEPTPVPSEIRSGWFKWTCQSPAPDPLTIQTIASQTTGQHGLTVYTGSSVGTLTQIATSGAVSAGNPASVQFTPTAGTTYYFSVASTLDRETFQITWFGPANLAAPAVVFQYVRVEVYDPSGMNKITELPRRFGVQWTETLNTPGAGQFSIHVADEILTAYPTLFNHRNIVKFWMGSTCVFGFRIQKKETTLVSNDEMSGWIKTVSGPSVHYLMDDFMIKHYALRPGTAYDDRNYNWTAPPSGWFNPSRWTDKYNTNTLKNPPGGKPGTAARKRPKYGFPKKWKDSKAQWMWLSVKPNLNESHYRSPRPIRGLHYWRRNIWIPKNGTPVRLYASADANMQVYLDGDLALSRDGKDKGYKTFVFFDAILDKGMHTVALFMQTRDRTNVGDRNEAILFSMARMNSKGKPAEWLMRSGKGWYCYHGWGVQGWNRAQILTSIVNEAKARGNHSANYLSLGFSTTTDSNGQAWAGDDSQPIKVTTSALAAQAILSEGDMFDVWVDPGSMQIEAYNRKGSDKSNSVVLDRGYNLLDWKVEDTDDVKNDLLTRYERGWVQVTDPGSIATYGDREAGLELGGVQDDRTATILTQQAIAGVSSARKAAGGPEFMKRAEFSGDGSFVGVEGAYPFLDFTIGDIIKAPGDDGVLVRHRVLGLAATENADGYMTFDPDLEVV